MEGALMPKEDFLQRTFHLRELVLTCLNREVAKSIKVLCTTHLLNSKLQVKDIKVHIKDQENKNLM